MTNHPITGGMASEGQIISASLPTCLWLGLGPYVATRDSVAYDGNSEEVDVAVTLSELPILPRAGDDDVEAVVASEVVLRYCLLIAIGECNICKAENEEFPDAWLGEIKALVAVGFWPVIVAAEAAIRGLSEIQTLKRRVPKRNMFRSSMVKTLQITCRLN